MKNMNKKSINLGFKILSILAFSILVMPASASATGYGTNFVYSTGYNYQVPQTSIPAPVVNPTNTNSSNNPSTPASETTPIENEIANDTDKNYSDLAANAIFGSNSFLPSGLIQWIILAIIILLIVILARKLFGGEKNYHEAPMKHA